MDALLVCALLMALTASRAVQCRMGDWATGKDLNGSSLGLIKTLSWKERGGGGKKTLRKVTALAGTRIKHLLNASPEHYHCSELQWLTAGKCTSRNTQHECHTGRAQQAVNEYTMTLSTHAHTYFNLRSTVWQFCQSTLTFAKWAKKHETKLLPFKPSVVTITTASVV
jgi:hypothetical protein